MLRLLLIVAVGAAGILLMLQRNWLGAPLVLVWWLLLFGRNPLMWTARQLAFGSVLALVFVMALVRPARNSSIDCGQPPAASLSQEARVRQVINCEIGNSRTIQSLQVDSGGKIIIASYALAEGFNGYDVGFASREMANLFCSLRGFGFADYNIDLRAMVNLVDAFGNTSQQEGVRVITRPANLGRFNCENASAINLQVAADAYEVHPALEG